MQHQLINHSPDLKRLEQDGYELQIIGGQYLIVHHIPYVNTEKEIKYGSVVCVLVLAAPTLTARPDHTVYFIGQAPCDPTGVPLLALINNSQSQQLTPEIIINHYLSSKPACGYYDNYYDKIRTYCEILSAQAKFIDNSVTARPNRLKIL